jgi:hypothetical protein
VSHILLQLAMIGKAGEPPRNPSLDAAGAVGAVSHPVNTHGSSAYTDVNTLLEQHAPHPAQADT